MRARSAGVRASLTLVVLLLAGCGSPGSSVAPLAADATLRIADAEDAPVGYASVGLFSAGAVAARVTSGADGALTIPPAAFDRALVSATGFSARELAREDLAGDIVLAAASATVEAADTTPLLRMFAPYEFGSIALGPEAVCGVRNTCGLSEPVVEVAGDGSVYATCCVGASPPVWVSRDRVVNAQL